MYSLIKKSEMPKLLKVIFYITLTITCIYWIGYLTYKLLNLLRIILHLISEKEHWWFVIIVLIGIVIATLLIAQFCFDLNPFGNFVNWIKGNINIFRNWLGDLIKSC